MIRRVAWVGLLGFAAGCTTLLGDFEVGSPGGGEDGGIDGTAQDGASQDGAAGDDANDSAAPPGCTGPGAPQCGAHATCVAGPTCACVTGYVAGGDAGAADGGGCVWAGLPLDPGLQDQPPSAWAITNGTFSPTATATGQLDPGNVTFSQAQVCPATGAGLGSVQQKFKMPSYADAEPFGLRVSGAAACSGESCGSQGVGFDFNGGFVAVSLAAAPNPAVLCLGERAYGGDVTLTLTPWADDCADSPTYTSYTALLDHVDIEPMNGCPVPGVITNADFEAMTGWAVSSPTTGTCSSSAEVANGDGTAGTRGGKVVSTCNGSAASVSEAMSIPYTETPNLALQMDFDDTSTDPAVGLDLGFAGHSLGNMAGAGQRTGKVCVPAWAKGLADTLGINLPFYVSGLHGSGSAEYRNFTFDNLAWVSDPSCPAAALVVDPGFERGDPGRAWQLEVSREFNSTPKAEIIADPNAHGGSNDLHLGIDLGGETAFALTTVTIPPADATGGPVLTVWYKLTASSQATFSSPFGNLAAAAAWTQATTCLDPHAAGHAFDVVFQVVGAGTTNAALTPAVDAYVDDLAVGTSASCPKN